MTGQQAPLPRVLCYHQSQPHQSILVHWEAACIHAIDPSESVNVLIAVNHRDIDHKNKSFQTHNAASYDTTCSTKTRKSKFLIRLT